MLREIYLEMLSGGGKRLGFRLVEGVNDLVASRLAAFTFAEVLITLGISIIEIILSKRQRINFTLWHFDLSYLPQDVHFGCTGAM